MQTNVDRTLTAARMLRKHMLYLRGKRDDPRGKEAPDSDVKFCREYIDTFRKQLIGLRGGSGHVDPNSEETYTEADELEQAVNFIVYVSRQCIPAPQPGMVELIRLFTHHFNSAYGDSVALTGKSILRALHFFYGVPAGTKSEMVMGIANKLLQLRIIRPNKKENGQEVQNSDSALYVVETPTMDTYARMDRRDLYSGMVAIVSPVGHLEGSNELIYLSHDRWMMWMREQDPEEMGQPLAAQKEWAIEGDEKDGAAFSGHPQGLRRVILGNVLQLVNGYLHDEGQSEQNTDACGIVTIDGLKFVLVHLTATKAPTTTERPNVDNTRMKKERVDGTTVMIVAIPDGFSDGYIRTSIRSILYTLDALYGPRSLWATNAKQYPRLPFRTSASDPASATLAFRFVVRQAGSRVLAMLDELFFRDDIPHSVRALKSSAAQLLGGLTDTPKSPATAPSQDLCGLPTWTPFTFSSRLSTHALSRRSCSNATQLLLSAMTAAEKFGGSLATAIYYNNAKIMSSTTPVLTAVLQTWCACSFHEADPRIPSLLSTRSMLPAGVCDGLFSHPSQPEGIAEVIKATLPRKSSTTFGGSGSPGRSAPRASNDEGAGGAMSPKSGGDHSSGTAFMSPTAQRAESDASGSQQDGSFLHPLASMVYQGAFFVTETLAPFFTATDPKGEPVEVTPGWYPVVRLTTFGLQVVMILSSWEMIDSEAGSPVGSPTMGSGVATPLSDGGNMWAPVEGGVSDSQMHPIQKYFIVQYENIISRDMFTLAAQLDKHDIVTVRGESKVGGNDAEAQLGQPAPNRGQQGDKSTGGPPSLAYVHDLFLGTGEFIGTPELASDSSSANPSMQHLLAASAFLRDATSASALLGKPLHPTAVSHADDTMRTAYPPLAQQPTSRVILGRSAFAGRAGSEAILARQCGGQQSFFTTSDANASTWGMEDVFTEYLKDLPSHHTVL